MTNAGVRGFPSGSGAVPDGAVTGVKLAAPLGWGKLASGLYYFASGTNSVTTSATLTNGTLRVHPFYVPNACVLSRIGADVTSAGDSGSKYRLGIYADNGSGYPGTLVLDAGTIAGDSNTVQEITISQALDPGMYWIGGVVQVVTVTQPTIRVINAVTMPYVALGTSAPTAGQVHVGYQQGSVTGALPPVFTSTVSGATPVPRIFVKIT